MEGRDDQARRRQQRPDRTTLTVINADPAERQASKRINVEDCVKPDVYLRIPNGDRFRVKLKWEQYAQDQRNRRADPGHLSAPVTQQWGKKPRKEGRRQANRPLNEDQMEEGMLIGPSWQEGVSKGRGDVHIRGQE